MAGRIPRCVLKVAGAAAVAVPRSSCKFRPLLAGPARWSTILPPTPPSNDNVAVKEVKDINKVIVATDDFPMGTVLVHSTTTAAEVLPEPTMYTVCVAPGQHVDVSAPLRYTPHSCAPCGKIEFEALDDGGWIVRVVATRPVKRGEWVTFDYATTEWSMDSPFACGCGAPSCRGHVQGAAHLTPAQAASIFPNASPVVQELMKEHFGAAVAEGPAAHAR